MVIWDCVKMPRLRSALPAAAAERPPIPSFSNCAVESSPHGVTRDAKRNTLLAIYFVTATTAKEVLNNVQKNIARSA